MKKRMVPWVLTLAVVFAFSLVSCKADDSDDKSGKVITGTGLDYTSYPADYAIIVTNNSNKNLVLFKNSLKDSNMIGAVQKKESTHYIKNNKNLFNSTSDFILIAITEDDYVANKETLYALENSPFARVYAFYNSDGDNKTVFKISELMGGNAKIILSNTTSYHIELRKDQKDGEPIGYAAPYSSNTTFLVTPTEHSWDAYPIFIKYIPIKNARFEFFPEYGPTALNEALRGHPKYETIDLKANGEVRLFADKWKTNDVVLKTGSAYITIQNDSSARVSFFEGSKIRNTTLGQETIEQGKSEVFEIPFPQNVDKTYPATRTVSKGILKLGTPKAPLDIPAFTFKVETMYSLKITGSDAANLVLEEITETGAVNWDNL